MRFITPILTAILILLVLAITKSKLPKLPEPESVPCSCACKPEGCYTATFAEAKCALWENAAGNQQSCCFTYE